MAFTLRIPVIPVQTRPTRKPEVLYNDDEMLGALNLFQTLSFLRKIHELKTKQQKWVKKIEIQGVDPERISMNVNGEKLHLRAIKETGDSENGDTTEIRRTFVLPENLDTEKIECKVNECGFLRLEAPFKPENKEQEESPREEPAKMEKQSEDKSQEVEKKEQNVKETSSLPKIWKRRFCLKGFNKENLKVSVKENLVTIEGEIKMSENDCSSLSMTKVISIPENVVVDYLKCRKDSEGILELEAPFMNDNEDANKSMSHVSMEKEGRLNSNTDLKNDESRTSGENENSMVENDNKAMTDKDDLSLSEGNNTDNNETKHAKDEPSVENLNDESELNGSENS